jgi:hypothetical protein
MSTRNATAAAAFCLVLCGIAAPVSAQAINPGISANTANRDVSAIPGLSNSLRQSFCLAANPDGQGCKGGPRKPEPAPRGGRRR